MFILLFYMATLLERSCFNISFFRLDICYPYPQPDPYAWFPGGAWGDFGILDQKLKLGIGTSLYEANDYAAPHSFTMGSFFPIHLHFAPYIQPYGSYFSRFAYLLLLTVSFSNWGEAYNPYETEYYRYRYFNLGASFSPGPLVGLKLGYIRGKIEEIQNHQEFNISAFWCGIEAKLGGWFSIRPQSMPDRPSEMRVIEVNKFIINLKKEIMYEYSDDMRFTVILERLNVFHQIILKKMKLREKIIKMSTNMGCLLGGGISYLVFLDRGCTQEGCVGLAALVGIPLSAACGSCLGYASSYFYSDLPLTKEEIEILNSIIEDYNKLKNNE